METWRTRSVFQSLFYKMSGHDETHNTNTQTHHNSNLSFAGTLYKNFVQTVILGWTVMMKVIEQPVSPNSTCTASIWNQCCFIRKNGESHKINTAIFLPRGILTGASTQAFKHTHKQTHRCRYSLTLPLLLPPSFSLSLSLCTLITSLSFSFTHTHTHTLTISISLSALPALTETHTALHALTENRWKSRCVVHVN